MAVPIQKKAEEQRDRIVNILKEFGYTLILEKEYEGLIHTKRSFTFAKGEWSLSAILYEKVCEIKGKYPIIGFKAQRPDILYLKTSLTDKTVQKRIAEFVEQFEIAMASADEAVAKKEKAEAVAQNATYTLRQALNLHIDDSSYNYKNIEVKIWDPLSVGEPYQYRVTITGMVTPQEMITIGKLLESMDV